MPYDLGLLLQPIALQRPAWLQDIVVPAQRMPPQYKIPPPMLLRLPHMRHLVDEMPLQVERRRVEVIAILCRAGVKMEVAHRRHGNLRGLQREPLAPLDPHRPGIDLGTEDAADQRLFPRRQPSFAANRAGGERVATSPDQSVSP